MSMIGDGWSEAFAGGVQLASKRPFPASRPTRHWVACVARTMISGGIVSPSAFTVFKLTTSSNIVSCSIGRSAGIAPFSIRST